MYSQLLWDHVRHPRNRGTLPDALIGQGRYQRCGDRLTLYLQVDNDRIIDAAFQAKSCGPVVAVASYGTELLKGMTIEEARQISILEMNRELGGLPPSKRHAYLIFLECLNQALPQP